MNSQTLKTEFLIHATYLIDPADTFAFKTLVTAMADAAKSVPGCLFLEATQSVSDPNSFHLVEAWTSQDAFANYGRSETFQTILGAALKLRIKARSGEKFFVSRRENLQMPG